MVCLFSCGLVGVYGVTLVLWLLFGWLFTIMLLCGILPCGFFCLVVLFGSGLVFLVSVNSVDLLLCYLIFICVYCGCSYIVVTSLRCLLLFVVLLFSCDWFGW